MKYDPRLSGLRGISALGVMLYHTVTLPVIFLGSSIFDVGWVGVSMFLMLSMYLLLNSLDANPNLKHYYLRRIKRIWPIYYGVVTAGFLIYHFSAGLLVQYFTFTQYWINPTNGVGALGVFWTLQLEEFMYLIIPFIHSSKRKSDIASPPTTPTACPSTPAPALAAPAPPTSSARCPACKRTAIAPACRCKARCRTRWM